MAVYDRIDSHSNKDSTIINNPDEGDSHNFAKAPLTSQTIDQSTTRDSGDPKYHFYRSVLRLQPRAEKLIMATDLFPRVR